MRWRLRLRNFRSFMACQGSRPEKAILMNISKRSSEKGYDSEGIASANFRLRYAIRCLEGDPRCGGGPFGSCLALVIGIKAELDREGWSWQAARLDNWINRARARKGFIHGKYSPIERVLPPKADQSSETGEASKRVIKLHDFLWWPSL